MNLREWALPLYTILTQLAVGSLLVLWIIRSVAGRKYQPEQLEIFSKIPVLILLSTLVVALIGSHFHLSKPHLSFLAVRNFRYSWLSREIVFSILAFISVILLSVLQWWKPGRWLLGKVFLGWFSIVLGLINVYCMANIYLLPTQVAWDSNLTITSYFTVMLLLGCSSLIIILLMDLRFAKQRNSPDDEINFRIQILHPALAWLAGVSFLLVALRIGMDFYHIELLQRLEHVSAQASVELLLGLYRPLFIIRICLSVLGAVWLVGVTAYFLVSKKSVFNLLGAVYLGSLLILVGEILDRFLFYATHVRIGL